MTEESGVFVSVIIPCFNAERWIRDAVRSVLEQGITGLEIIVVDDGSTDFSARLVEREFPSIRLIRAEHAGVGRARNLGTRAASGKFIQYLDADDLLAAGKIKAQSELLRQTGADIAYGDWEERVYLPSGAFKKGRLFRPRLEALPEAVIKVGGWCPPAAYLFRAEITRKAGEWKEDLPMCEDVRFLWSCAVRGARFAYTPGLMAYYRVHAGQAHLRADRPDFIQGCLRVASEAEQWCLEQGLTPERQKMLLGFYEHVARASFGRYPELFESAFAALNRLRPGYVPDQPLALSYLSKLVGYRRAEALASRYRGLKRLFAG